MQKRGRELREYLIGCVGELKSRAEAQGEIYVYSQKALAGYAKVSRETVRGCQDFIDETLNKEIISKYVVAGGAHKEKLLGDVEKLQGKLDDLSEKYNALRAQHVKIFSALIRSSVDVSLLLNEWSDNTSVQFMVCPGCGCKLPCIQPSLTAT